ncbi:MAG: ABC transporter ATP-binding protein [Treponemataceae bacterium]|nr:ABC transporter ATP-binding protein [Treponemataceae bacterium]
MSREGKKCVVKIKGLTKTFSSDGIKPLTILNGLDMTVWEGSKTVICGASGSGKSTLLNIIGGLESVSSGTVVAGDYNVSLLSEKELTEYRSKYLGLIFQFHYLLKDFTALENVMLPSYMSGVSKKAAKERAAQLLCDVGLKDRMEHLPSQLSGGERQRAAVARALINDPSLILADEPTGNLDPENAALISDLLFNMVDKYHKTLLLVTHDMGLASRGDIRCCIKEGKLSVL